MSSRIVVDEDDPIDDIDDPPFEYKDVVIRKDKWVAEEFEILDFLGRGKFGEVKRCKELSSQREFAAKFICAPRAQDKKDVEHEVDIMKKLQHKRLIQLYDAFESKSEMCLVLEIIYGGELFDRVISEDFILTEKACVAFLRQICEGLEYMHGRQIIHLDMKPENILCLTRTGNRIKIIDFGLAREFHPKKDLRVLFGTPEFMAPEVVQYEPISFGTDMWSVGVICYVLLSGLSPFMGDTDADTLSNVIKCQFDYNYAEFEDVSVEAKDMISNLLVKDKAKRLTATDCLNHAWLQKPHYDNDESGSLQLTKKRLKRFVYRRKWQKIVNAIIALRRMGFQLMSIRRSSLGHVATSEEFYERDTTTGGEGDAAEGTSKAGPGEGDIPADDLQRVLEVKNYDLNKRKPSDSGYESVAVGDKDASKDFALDGEPEIVLPSCSMERSEPSTKLKEAPADVAHVESADVKPKSTGASVGENPNKDTTKRGGATATTTAANSSSSDTLAASSATNNASNDTAKKSWSPKPLISSRKNDGGASSSGKKSVIEKFGGLFLNHNKDKDATLKREKSSKKSGTSSKKTNKDKPTLGVLVKKDSTKRKVGTKPKQENYVTTPGVKKKDIFFSSDTKIEANGSVVSSSAANTAPPKETNNAEKNSCSNGTNGQDNGDKNGDEGTPSLLLGNVKNKRRMFENNGRAS